ncbi:MAG: hypothetical protein EOO74_07630 [Myxococcales bacterium]|nr:MAG: hypothetical protein EOO74_07630 [Myxococcales bacterium]
MGNKTATPGGAGSAPPGGIPTPGIPTPSAAIPPPAALSGGIPVPPFATPSAPAAPAAPSRPPAPTVDPNDPYASVKASVSHPAPQAVAIQIDESAIDEAKKKVTKFIPIAGVAGVLVGLLIGNVLGSGSEVKKREGMTISGASLMVKDLEASNAKIKELSDKILAANKSLREKKFPETFDKELGELNVPFDGSKLFGRGIGSYDESTQKMLFRYVSDVDALNDRREALQRIFKGQKAQIIEGLQARENPKLNYAIVVTKTAKGQALGSIAPLTEGIPFAADKEFPKEFKFKNTADGAVMAGAKYESGDAFFSPQKPLAILIEPNSIGSTFPSNVVGQIVGQVVKTGELLNGVSEGEDNKPGLIKDGEVLVEKLKKLAARGG